MPEVTADLVINGYNYQTNNIPLEFKENPTTYEVTVVDSTSNNKPPVVSLNSARSRYNLQSIVTLTATASDPNNDELAFEWEIESCNSSDKGTLEKFRESANESIYYWNSPDTDCTATISVRVYEKNTYQRLQGFFILQR